MVGYKNLYYCDTSTLDHLNLQNTFRDFIANSFVNNEKPDRTALENVPAADDGTFTH